MIYLAFAPGFWKEVRKILVISQVLGALTSPEFMVKSWFWIAASSQVSLSWDWVQRGQVVRGYIANYTCIMKAQWKAWMLEFLEVIDWQMQPWKEDWAYWLANASMQRGLSLLVGKRIHAKRTDRSWESTFLDASGLCALSLPLVDPDLYPLE